VTQRPNIEVAGAILTGGLSSRLGRDKALFDPYGFGSMLDVGMEAIRGAGIGSIASIGGEPRSTSGSAIEHVADLFPGEGPLGGIITALRWAPTDLVVVLACDMPFSDSGVINGMVTADGADTSSGVICHKVGDREQPLTALWRRSVALDLLEAEFQRGERAPRRVLTQLSSRIVETGDPDLVVDIDSSDDVDRYAPIAKRRRPGDWHG
jgi:molybdopterin-guanine dinucleotide biosynthesis protein A